MALDISENMDPRIARQIGTRLPDSDLTLIRSEASDQIEKISLGVAVRIAIVLAGNPANLKAAIDLISEVLERRQFRDLNDVLNNEVIAAEHFLKAFESQEAYSLFYQAFDRFYQKVVTELPVPADVRRQRHTFFATVQRFWHIPILCLSC